MTELVEYTLADGHKVVIEVDEPEGTEGLARATRKRGDNVIEASQRFEDAMDVVRPTTEVIHQKLQSFAQAPDEITVEFGLKLTLQAGAVIASASTEGNFTVSVLWKKDGPSV